MINLGKLVIIPDELVINIDDLVKNKVVLGTK